jgi:hypothetical protein
MNKNAVVTGLCGLLLFAAPAFADPLTESTEKAYRLLQTLSSQLKKARASIGPHGPAQTAAALATADAQVRSAFVHCCRALYTAQLTAAKAALARHSKPEALHYLLKANETLETCDAPTPAAEPETDDEALALSGPRELK